MNVSRVAYVRQNLWLDYNAGNFRFRYLEIFNGIFCTFVNSDHLDFLVRRNKHLMPKTKFRTRFWKMKRRINIFQDISRTGNLNSNFFPDDSASG